MGSRLNLKFSTSLPMHSNERGGWAVEDPTPSRRVDRRRRRSERLLWPWGIAGRHSCCSAGIRCARRAGCFRSPVGGGGGQAAAPLATALSIASWHALGFSTGVQHLSQLAWAGDYLPLNVRRVQCEPRSPCRVMCSSPSRSADRSTSWCLSQKCFSKKRWTIEFALGMSWLGLLMC
jgi:hypothetical protein